MIASLTFSGLCGAESSLPSLTDTKKSTEVPKSAPQTASSQEPSYFEIPTKDTPLAGKMSGEATSREQEAGVSSAAEPTHGHASFTIEFDSGATGKVTVKDRVAKVGPETRPRPKRAVGEELSPLQTAMVAAEVKVADWLAQNELPLALKDLVAEDDGESVKSDVPVQLRSLKGVYVRAFVQDVYCHLIQLKHPFDIPLLNLEPTTLPSQTANTRTVHRATQRMLLESSAGLRQWRSAHGGFGVVQG